MKDFRMLVVAIVAAVLAVGSAAPAGATRCVKDPGARPQNLLAGRPIHGEALFERYDFALVGTVTAIRTNEAQGGATRTIVDVHAGFGIARLAPTIDISSDDPGWTHGYNFQHGATYFIPVAHPGPNGQPYYSFVCDPIAQLDGPAAAAELEQIAADNGVMIAREIPAAPSGSDDGGMPVVGVVAIVGLAVMALLAIAGVAMVAGRRRSA